MVEKIRNELEKHGWKFTPTFKSGVGGKIDGIDAEYGWYEKIIGRDRIVVCVTIHGIIRTVTTERWLKFKWRTRWLPWLTRWWNRESFKLERLSDENQP